jgi:hypothetical protein
MWDHPPELDDFDIRCPISKVCFRNVCLAMDGFHYERAEIERWLMACGRNYRSPVTNQPLCTTRVYPDENKQRIVDAAKHRCIQSFKRWWHECGDHETVGNLAKAVLKLTEIADPKECIFLLSDVDKFNLLAYNTDEIVSFMRGSGVLCCLCGSRLSGCVDPSLCSECMWEFICCRKLVSCAECGNRLSRSNDDCNICGPLPKLIRTHLTIDSKGPPFKIEAVDQNIFVSMTLEHIQSKYGTCIQVFRIAKWNDIDILTDDTNRLLLKSVYDILSVIPGLDSLTIDCVV